VDPLLAPISPNNLIVERPHNRGMVVKDLAELRREVGKFVSARPDAPYAFVI
jgi:hypothetical protein